MLLLQTNSYFSIYYSPNLLLPHSNQRLLKKKKNSIVKLREQDSDHYGINWKIIFAYFIRLYKELGQFDSFHNLWGFYVYEETYNIKSPNCISKQNFNFTSWFQMISNHDSSHMAKRALSSLPTFVHDVGPFPMLQHIKALMWQD